MRKKKIKCDIDDIQVLYNITFSQREYFYGDRPRSHIEDQLTNMNEDYRYLFLWLIGYEAKVKEKLGKNSYFKFSDTDLIYTKNNLILRIRIFNFDLEEKIFEMYRDYDERQWKYYPI